MPVFNPVRSTLWSSIKRRLRGAAAPVVIVATPLAVMTLSQSAVTIPANAQPGTLLATIGSVPAGVTPTFAPNDGRVVVSGDPLNGWKLVLGLSAISAGTINGTVACVGAQSALIAITIGAAFDPSQMATKPRAAWSMKAADVTASGGIGSSVAAGWGSTSGALTLNASIPFLAGGGPQAPGTTATDVIQTTSGSSQYGSFTALDLATTPSDLEVCSAVSYRGANIVLFGSTAGATSQAILTSTSILIKTATSGTITLPLPFTLKSGGMYVVGAALPLSGQWIAYVNGVAGATTDVTGTTGYNKGFNVNAIGRGGGTYSTAYFGSVLLFAAILSAADRASLYGCLQPFVSSTYYVASAGADTNLGWNQASPYATIDKVVTAAPTQGPGAIITIAPKGGDIFRRTASFSLSSNLVMDGGLWGTGWAEFRGSIAPTDWTLVSGTAGTPGCVYSRTEAQHPYQGALTNGGFIWDTGVADYTPLSSYNPQPGNPLAWQLPLMRWALANPKGQRLADGGKGATPDAGSYGYSGTTIYVALADGGNPNGRVEIAYRTQATSTTLQMGQAFTAPNPANRYSRLRMRYYDAALVQTTGAGSVCDRLDIAYCQSDGLDGSGSGTGRFEQDCLAVLVGNGARDGSDGDGFSNHGQLTVRYRNLSLLADRGGFDDVETCNGNSYNCAAIGQRPIMTPGNGTTDAGRGTQNFYNFVGVLTDGQAYPSLVHNRGGILNVYGSTLVGVGSASGKNGSTTEVRSGGGSTTPATTIMGSIVTGVATPKNNISSAGGTTDDYNLWGVAPANAGSHDIVGDPKFTNAANLDFSLASGTPCKGAGVAVAAMIADYALALRPSQPSIGAFEAT